MAGSVTPLEIAGFKVRSEGVGFAVVSPGGRQVRLHVDRQSPATARMDAEYDAEQCNRRAHHMASVLGVTVECLMGVMREADRRYPDRADMGWDMRGA
jgi:hypothetical protein